MFEKIFVHPRVGARHPDISEADVVTAWQNAISMRYRDFGMPMHILAAGMDAKGRMIEMVGAEQEDGTLIVYHAMRLTEKAAKELGLC